MVWCVVANAGVYIMYMCLCAEGELEVELTHESSMRIMNLKSRSRRLLGSTCQDQGSASGEGGGGGGQSYQIFLGR